MKRSLLGLGIIGPGLALLLAACGGGSEPRSAPADAIVMTSNAFEPAVRTIKAGDTVTFVNETRGALHILVVGEADGSGAPPGAPSFGGAAGHRSERGDVWTTPAWTTPGTFKISCTVHPAMDMAVTVTQS